MLKCSYYMYMFIYHNNKYVLTNICVGVVIICVKIFACVEIDGYAYL